ncbi:complement component receptor 1-like protein [Styela clava]
MKIFLATLMLALIGFGSTTFYFPKLRFCSRLAIANAYPLKYKLYRNFKYAYVKCHSGYKLDKSSKIQCKYGRWYAKGGLPKCIRTVYCKYPGAPSNGYISSKKDTYPVNYKVTWGCNSGYVRHGGAYYAICQSNGQFSASKPSCRAITCSRPDVPQYAKISPDKSSYDVYTKVKYTCDGGSVMSGSSSRVCQKNGKWSGSAPKCKRVKCEKHMGGKTVASVVPDKDFYDVGEKVVFLCKKGYYISGKPGDFCESGPKWRYGSSAKTVCKKESHPGPDLYCRLPKVDSAVVATPDKKLYLPGSIVKLSCKKHHEYDGDRTAICGWDGQFHLTAKPKCTPTKYYY